MSNGRRHPRNAVVQEGGEAGARPYPIVPFSLILASSMAKVMWSWCSMPLATRLNATWAQKQGPLLLPRDRVRAPPRPPGSRARRRRTWKRSFVMLERRCVWSVTPFRFGFSYRTLW